MEGSWAGGVDEEGADGDGNGDGEGGSAGYEEAVCGEEDYAALKACWGLCCVMHAFKLSLRAWEGVESWRVA